ncbi:MAG TPA: DUF2442 domain-containing protein [Verrucomicrobiae bacterium]|nr:DUF2442 domain-containing protein [Verrucomicrobiae bacterium]
MRKITSLTVLQNYHIKIQFDDGVERDLDFSSKARTGVFALWNDYENFRKAHVGDAGELVWNDQIGFCADALWLSPNLQIDPMPTDC